MFNKFFELLESHKILNDAQFGFRKKMLHNLIAVVCC